MNELFRCSTCRNEKKAVTLESVPDQRKVSIRLMMDAMNSYLQYSPGAAALIVYCKKCNEYSTVVIDDF